MRADTLLAMWFTVYGNINKTWKKCHDMQLSCIDRLNNLSPILIGVSNRCVFHIASRSNQGLSKEIDCSCSN